MTTTPRKFDSEIRITQNGKWIFRGQEITQDNVLEFFKKNIREDDLGIYITNTYAELTEHGYLEAETIFLKIINSIEKDNIIYLQGEDDSTTPLFDFYFYSDSNEKIFCMRKSDKFIKFTFNRQMHSYISNLLSEDNGSYFIKVGDNTLPVSQYNKPIDVKIPNIYKKV
jgi:hypothetical protein